jgi:hypothetical protein
MRFRLCSDGQSPTNCALSRRVPGVFVPRKGSGGVGKGFTAAPAASIDARPDRSFSRRILPVELRTDADFHVVTTLEECHGSPLFVDGLEAYCRRWLEDIGRGHRMPVAKAVSTQVIVRSAANVRGNPHKRSAPLRDAAWFPTSISPVAPSTRGTPGQRRCPDQRRLQIRRLCLTEPSRRPSAPCRPSASRDRCR